MTVETIPATVPDTVTEVPPWETTDRTLTAHATLTLIEERITECRKTEQWYRANSWAVWNDLRHENAVELRALLKLARKARQTARLAVPDPMDEAKRRMSMDEALEAAYGHQVRPGGLRV